jgi:hypothetical protein
MAFVASDQLRPGASESRWDAEFFASPDRALLARLFASWPDWCTIDEATVKLSSGHTPRGHDLEHGEARLITLEAVDPLFLDPSKLRRVTPEHVDGELARAAVNVGDVVLTIKRRLLNASLVADVPVPTAVNQDVVVATPSNQFLPGFFAAALNSRIGKAQAARNQTEQINPYVSVVSLRRLKVPVVDVDEQTRIDRLVRERLSCLARAAELTRQAKEQLASALGVPDEEPLPKTTIRDFRAAAVMDRYDAEYFCAEPMKSGRAGPFETTTLADPRVATYLGAGVTPAASEYGDSGTPILKVSGVTAFGTAEWRGDRVRLTAAAARSERGRNISGDVLMLAAAHHVRYIGKAGVLRAIPDGAAECRSVGELVTVRPGIECAPGALATYLNLPTVLRQVQRLARGQSAHLYPRDLVHLRVPVLPRELQQSLETILLEAQAQRDRGEDLRKQAISAVERIVMADV